MSLKAILFDLDGLLVDSEPLSRQSWAEVIAEAGYELSDAIFLQMIGRTEKEVKRLFKQAFGEDFPFEAVYQRREQHFVEALEREGVPPKPGAHELLAYLERVGLQKAVASSTYRYLAEMKLRGAGLHSYFEVIVTGDDVAHGKPAPDIFLEAARRLGVTPAECIVLEDSTAGIQAANAAGMRCIHIPDVQPVPEAVRRLAQWHAHSLAEVPAILEGLRRNNHAGPNQASGSE